MILQRKVNSFERGETIVSEVMTPVVRVSFQIATSSLKLWPLLFVKPFTFSSTKPCTIF